MRSASSDALRHSLLCLACIAGITAVASASGTNSITYQGLLRSDGAPVTGTYDMRFTLYNATGGAFPPVLCLDNVSVVDGLFTVELDFGPGAFASEGSPRHLQIDVRPDDVIGNCSTGAFTALSPRQRLAAAPFALQTRGLTTNAAGNVGVGGSAGDRTLRVWGGLEVLDVDEPLQGVRIATNRFTLLDSAESEVFEYDDISGRHQFMAGGATVMAVYPSGDMAVGGGGQPEGRLHLFRAFDRVSQVFATMRNNLPPSPATAERSPQSVTVLNTGGGAWTNAATGPLADDGVRASAPFAPNPNGVPDEFYTRTLRLSNFNFNLPPGSVITGITVTVDGYASVSCSLVGGGSELAARSRAYALLRSGSVTSSSRDAAMFVGGSDQATTLGVSTNDVWGVGQWTAALINSPDFAVDLTIRGLCTKTVCFYPLPSGCLSSGTVSCGDCFNNGTAFVDHVFVTVHYSASPVGSVPVAWSIGIPEQSGAFAVAPGVSLESPKLVVDDQGRVGLGSASPRNRLELFDTGPLNNAAQLRLSNASAANGRFGALRISDGGFVEIASASIESAPFTFCARLATNGTWSSTSDARLKREVHAADGHLDAVLGLRPVRFNWTMTGETDVGLLAQEVRPLLPHLVTGDESTGYLSIDYARLSVTAVGAIQEQQAQIESLQAEIRQLRAALKRLEAELVAPAARAP